MELDPTKRFTDRVADYVKHRPHYPDAVLDFLSEEFGLRPGVEVDIADIGAGTGIFSAQLMARGWRVWAVEPNAAMRAAAVQELGQSDLFVSVDGTAEATGLPAGALDLVCAAQAFHWFDAPAAKAEWRRILRPAGAAVLVWNRREAGGTPFLDGYERILREYGVDYGQVSERNITPEKLNAFFGEYEIRQFRNEQTFDLEGLKGRVRSSSYSPLPEHPNYAAMSRAIESLFRECARDGKVSMRYSTEVYWGRP